MGEPVSEAVEPRTKPSVPDTLLVKCTQSSRLFAAYRPWQSFGLHSRQDVAVTVSFKDLEVLGIATNSNFQN